MLQFDYAIPTALVWSDAPDLSCLATERWQPEIATYSRLEHLCLASMSPTEACHLAGIKQLRSLSIAADAEEWGVNASPEDFSLLTQLTSLKSSMMYVCPLRSFTVLSLLHNLQAMFMLNTATDIPSTAVPSTVLTLDKNRYDLLPVHGRDNYAMDADLARLVRVASLWLPRSQRGIVIHVGFLK